MVSVVTGNRGSLGSTARLDFKVQVLSAATLAAPSATVTVAQQYGDQPGACTNFPIRGWCVAA